MQSIQEIEDNSIYNQYQQNQLLYHEEIDKLQQPTIKTQTQKQEQSTNQSLWTPVKLQFNINKSKLKLQMTQNELFINNVTKRRAKNVLDLSNPALSKNYLIKLAKDYHKKLVQQVTERLKLQQKQGVKTENQWVSADKNIRIFPLFKKQTDSEHFDSIDVFKQNLKHQEVQLVKQIGDPNLVSVFYDSFIEKVKDKGGNQVYLNFKCQIQGCRALIKCSVQRDTKECILYHLNNKHNHTITGKIIDSYSAKIEAPIVIDEELHELFGFNKGVRSQTRDIKYQNPQERKIKIAQQKRESKQRLKNKKKQNYFDQDICQEQDQIRTQKQFLFPSKRKRLTNKQISGIQYHNMYSQLLKQGFIVQTHEEYKKNQFIQLSIITKSQFIRYAQSSNTLRFIIRDRLIKLNKNQKKEMSVWSIMLVTILNQALKPIVVAICFSSKIICENLPEIFQLLRKVFPQQEYFIGQYNNNSVLENLSKIYDRCSKLFTILLDENDILNSLKKQFVEENHINALKKIMNPTKWSNWSKIEKFLGKKSQNNVLSKLSNFKQYTLIGNQKREGFFGFQVDLSCEKQFMIKLKHRIKKGSNRNSLQLQFRNMMQLIQKFNRENELAKKLQQILQIEKIHRDSQLYPVRKSISPYILNKFYVQYGKALTLVTREQDGHFLFENNKIITNHQQCLCKFSLVTGIPCRHIIRVLKQKSLSYLSRFNKRWILTQQFYNLSSSEYQTNSQNSQNSNLDQEQSNKFTQKSKNKREKSLEKQTSQFINKKKRIKKIKNSKKNK